MQKSLLLVDSSWHCGGDCDDSDDCGGDDGNDGDDGGDSGGDSGDSDDGGGLHFIGDQANPERGEESWQSSRRFTFIGNLKIRPSLFHLCKLYSQ